MLDDKKKKQEGQKQTDQTKKPQQNQQDALDVSKTPGEDVGQNTDRTLNEFSEDDSTKRKGRK